jgi:hypothetical protein
MQYLGDAVRSAVLPVSAMRAGLRHRADPHGGWLALAVMSRVVVS